MARQIKAYVLLFILTVITGVGVSVLMKTDLGLGPWDAAGLTLAYLFDVKMGTMAIITNVIAVIAQIVILGKDFKKINLLQIPIALVLGTIINLFGYTIFKDLVIEGYVLRMTVFVLATSFIAVIIGGIVKLNLTTFAAEGLCGAIATRWNKDFAKTRQMMDYTCLVLIIILTVVFSLKLSIREASVVSAIVFSKVLGLALPKIEKLYKKWDIID